MLYDQQTNRSLDFEAWQWRNELNAETAELDAAREMEEFLGFSGDRERVPAVINAREDSLPRARST